MKKMTAIYRKKWKKMTKIAKKMTKIVKKWNNFILIRATIRDFAIMLLKQSGLYFS